MMRVSTFNDPIPYVYIENLYTDFELQKIWYELDYYQSNGDVLIKDNRTTNPA